MVERVLLRQAIGATRARTASGAGDETAQRPIRYPPYERKVRAGRHAFVFYRDSVASIPIVKPLERYGYRPHVVGGLVVYTLPPGR